MNSDKSEMSYCWAVPGPANAPTIQSASSNHSSLHQERAYLLSALAAEESRGEQLHFSLDATRKKLKAAEHEEGSEDAVKNYKKAVAGIVRKLRRSQKSQKAMINNLAAVTSRMQLLEQHQWRKAQFEYSQGAQYPSIDIMAANMQNLALVSPITPGCAFQSQTSINPFTPGFISPLQLTATPTTQWTTAYEQPWGSPLYTPFYEQQYTQSHGRYQAWMQNMSYPQGEARWSDKGATQSPDYVYQPPKLRTMSLPVVQSPKSWARRGASVDVDEEEEAISPKSAINLARRFNLVGAASSGLRLQTLI